MAVLNLAPGLPEYQWWPVYFEPGDPGAITVRNATTFKWTNPDGSVVTLKGTGFTYVDGVPTGGTVNSITVEESDGTDLITATQVGGDLPTLFDFAFGFGVPNQGGQEANGYNFMSALLRGNDTINGTDGSDDIAAGTNSGNDVINANGGNDYIKGDDGQDTINGGSGDDFLTYSQSFYEPSAFKGITVNLGAGTVADCWGYVDSFTGIEQFQGSKFADLFIGNNGNNFFSGLRGNDTFNGSGGFDEIGYSNDAQYGGKRGIVVDLAAGTVRDGFGNTDTLNKIESVIGTAVADSFKGGSLDDQFLGGGGVDTYNGGGGTDGVNFSFTGGDTGAVVNLGLTTGQVLNDGYGNIETLISIERIDGNELNDRFTGNALANELIGDRGNDTMTGKEGNDFLQGDAGADLLTGGIGADEFHYSKREGNDPWGDTITDFTSGQDFISIITGDFAGMTDVLQFRNGTSAGGTGSWFFFNAANDGLFWDADGTGSGAAVRVATMTGVNSLIAADIDLL